MKEEELEQKKNTSGDSLDPEIAELLEIREEQKEVAPDFTSLFGAEKGSESMEHEAVDLTKKRFTVFTKLQENPKPFFQNKDYYKSILAGEGEAAQRVHDLLSKYLKATDVDEKTMFRGKLIPAFWDLASGIAVKIGQGLAVPKLLLLRFGILAPNLLSPEQKDMMSRIIFENSTGEPVYYLDEWLDKIAKGTVRPSATDEVKLVKKDSNVKIIETIEKKRGQRQAEIGLLQGKIARFDERETSLREQVNLLLKHDVREDFGGLKGCFNSSQKSALSDIQDILRQLAAVDKEMADSYTAIVDIDRELEGLVKKAEGIEGDSAVDEKTVVSEFNTVRQMVKLCVGRQGNHFPILSQQYAKSSIGEIATRENVINEMAAVEALDPGLFIRTFKGQTARIVPHILLLANFGELGVCWEPFEKFNRATSRGRIAIPLYPKNVKVAVINALADLRWQVAKEKALHYWMEEGITGKYYQWFQERKLKGDVKEYFIRDYILWITKESQGTQKLDREIRGIFWRMMPFPQQIKDNLKNRGFVYSELYKKDQNIALSDGY